MDKANGNNDARENTVSPQQNPKRRFSRLTCIILIILFVALAGGFYLYTIRTGLEKTSAVKKYKPLSVPKDLIFSQGFNDTGRLWPPTEESWPEELKQNPLCELRKAYCERVGYDYAEFGCDCFSYQYYDSFDTYADDEEKFTVYYPKLWQQNIKDINSTFISQVKMSMYREGASCRIAYGIIDEKVLLSTNNALTANVNIKDEELLQITIPFNRDLNDEEKAAGYTQLTLIAVPHFPYSISKFGFIITSGDNQPLLEACVSEFKSILNSVIINYPSTKLTLQSNGILSIQDISSNFKTDSQERFSLLFENAATGKKEAVASEVFSQIQNLSDPFLTDNKLYYLDGPKNNPIIKTVDIFTGENKIVPLPYDKNTPIHSFFIEKDMLYFLSGKFCNEYFAKCSLDLKRYDIKSGAIEHLASGLISRDIYGFDASKDTLILRWSESDAGCTRREYETFTLSTKSLNKVGYYLFCDEGSKEGSEDLKDQFEKLAVEIDEVPYLIINNGVIFLPAEIKTLQNRIPIRVNTSEYTVIQ